MSVHNRNIYQNVRKVAGLTQESAAERLFISVESIRAYETGQRIPPNDVVERMIECYNAQYLAYQHLKESNALMSQIVPALEERDILQTSVRIYNQLKKIAENGTIDHLLAIAEDGVITEDERPVFDAILNEFQSLIKNGLELSVFCNKTSEEG